MIIIRKCHRPLYQSSDPRAGIQQRIERDRMSSSLQEFLQKKSPRYARAMYERDADLLVRGSSQA